MHGPICLPKLSTPKRQLAADAEEAKVSRVPQRSSCPRRYHTNLSPMPPRLAWRLQSTHATKPRPPDSPSRHAWGEWSDSDFDSVFDSDFGISSQTPADARPWPADRRDQLAWPNSSVPAGGAAGAPPPPRPAPRPASPRHEEAAAGVCGGVPDQRRFALFALPPPLPLSPTSVSL